MAQFSNALIIKVSWNWSDYAYGFHGSVLKTYTVHFTTHIPFQSETLTFFYFNKGIKHSKGSGCLASRSNGPLLHNVEAWRVSINNNPSPLQIHLQMDFLFILFNSLARPYIVALTYKGFYEVPFCKSLPGAEMKRLPTCFYISINQCNYFKLYSYALCSLLISLSFNSIEFS